MPNQKKFKIANDPLLKPTKTGTLKTKDGKPVTYNHKSVQYLMYEDGPYKLDEIEYIVNNIAGAVLSKTETASMGISIDYGDKDTPWWFSTPIQQLIPNKEVEVTTRVTYDLDAEPEEYSRFIIYVSNANYSAKESRKNNPNHITRAYHIGNQNNDKDEHGRINPKYLLKPHQKRNRNMKGGAITKFNTAKVDYTEYKNKVVDTVGFKLFNYCAKEEKDIVFFDDEREDGLIKTYDGEGYEKITRKELTEKTSMMKYELIDKTDALYQIGRAHV